MKQVFLNILLNAIQAMPQGGKLTVATFQENLPSLGEELVVSFRDSGEGIPPEIIEKIFEPFFSTKEEGIGLGLPIGQRIIEEHKGKIRVESYPQKGTTFYVYLPLS